AECQTDVVQIEERLRAESLVGEAAGETVKPLLDGFVVGVLYEDSEQLQRVALIPRRPALRVVNEVELAPAPAVLVAVHFMSGHFPLDRRDVELHGLVRRLALVPRIVRAPMTDDAHRIRCVCAESERP